MDGGAPGSGASAGVGVGGRRSSVFGQNALLLPSVVVALYTKFATTNFSSCSGLGKTRCYYLRCCQFSFFFSFILSHFYFPRAVNEGRAIYIASFDG